MGSYQVGPVSVQKNQKENEKLKIEKFAFSSFLKEFDEMWSNVLMLQPF